MAFDSVPEERPSDEVRILRGATELIERGWCQDHAACDEHGASADWEAKNAASFCTLGAVARATRSLQFNVFKDGVYDRVVAALKARLPDGYRGSVPAWNDAPERTKQEVLDLLRYAEKEVAGAVR